MREYIRKKEGRKENILSAPQGNSGPSKDQWGRNSLIIPSTERDKCLWLRMDTQRPHEPSPKSEMATLGSVLQTDTASRHNGGLISEAPQSSPVNSSDAEVWHADECWVRRGQVYWMTGLHQALWSQQHLKFIRILSLVYEALPGLDLCHRTLELWERPRLKESMPVSQSLIITPIELAPVHLFESLL